MLRITRAALNSCRLDIGPELSPTLMVGENNKSKLGNKRGQVPVGLSSGPIVVDYKNRIVL